MTEAKIRLFVDQPLGAGQAVALNADQAHYLFNVMRQGKGGFVTLFNGFDGAWRAEVAEAGRRGGILICDVQSAPQQMPPDLWLLFAPIKKARTDFIVEKATEMGAARITPVQTQHTHADRIRVEKLHAHAVEAAEQCGATFVPQVDDLTSLDRVLRDWPMGRQLLWCDEAMIGQAPVLSGERGGAWAILIGPEGGFSGAEQSRLRGLSFVHPISLGPRILRADTAAVAALTLWQAALGDWA